jgi:hypothetical protein
MAQLESGRNGDRGECRYVLWLPIQGLGNRMLGLVSTFLYALLTGQHRDCIPYSTTRVFLQLQLTSYNTSIFLVLISSSQI